MTTAASHEGGTLTRFAPRNVVGVVLFIAWGIATIMWVASTVNLAADGKYLPIITAVAAIALMVLLAVMEGAEVSVIARWKVLYPDRSRSELAGWLAARQLFVALIVTTATLLANREEVIVPGTDLSFDQGVALAVFDIAWTGFTVLWFAQIFPKHLAATNPDRYLSHLMWVFPVVRAVDKSGVTKPGAWTASGVERRLDWPMTDAEEMQEAALAQPESLDHIWRELIPERPASGGAQGSPAASQGERPSIA